MPKCKLDSTCRKLRKLLRTIGIGSAHIASGCNGHHPCQNAFDNVSCVVRSLNVDNAATITQFIKEVFDGELPIDRSRVALGQILQHVPFYCGEIDTEIQQPCQVQSCVYWSDNPWTRNCILYYLLDQHRASLDIKELTFLLGRPSTELRRRTNAITVQMRHWALKHKTAQAEDRLPVYIVAEECCAACGGVLDDNTTIYAEGYCYCSPECAKVKTPLDLRIEQDFQLPVERVLQICVDSFGAQRPMCHALDVTVKQLEELCDRHQISTAHLA